MNTAVHISTFHLFLRLGAAALLAGAVGVEREYRDHAAGFRTHILVGLGSALFTVAGAYGFSEFSYGHGVGTDPTRIAAQIVSGIGFLGAGAIIRTGISIRGLTTAATLWVVAAIGLACGAGFYSAAAITTGLILICLGPGRSLDRRIGRTRSGMLRVFFETGTPTGEIIELISAVASSNKLTIETGEQGGQIRTVCTLADHERAELMESLQRLDGVDRVDWA